MNDEAGFSTYGELIEAIKSRLVELKGGSPLSRLKQTALEGLRILVEFEKKRSELEKHTLVFIGVIGSGKTTAIAHLLGLPDDLLLTGAGGSTICEVRISLTEGDTHFGIEWHEEEKILALGDDFADAIIGKKYPQTQLANALPAEITRVLRNITELTTSREGKKRTDKAVNYLDEIDGTEIEKQEELRKYINSRLKSRIGKEPELINFKDSSSSDIEVFVRDVFKGLNSATAAEFTIPKQINIHLNENDFFGEVDLTQSLWNEYDCIVDTKGLDSSTGRQDIDQLTKDVKNILVFSSTFADAPQAYSFAQFERFAEQEPQWINRSRFMLLPRNEEPSVVVGAEDYEDGIDIKKENVENRFRLLAEGQPLNDFILFYNAKREGEAKDEITEELNKVAASNSGASIGQLAEDYLSITRFDNLEQEVQLINYLNDIYYREYNTEVVFNKEFVELFDEDAPHWNTRNAINKNRGKFWYHDVVYLSTDIVMRTLAKEAFKKIEEIEGKLSNVLQQLTTPTISNYLSERLKTEKNSFIGLINEEIRAVLEETVFNRENKSLLWGKLMDPAIRGNGFNQRVSDIYAKELEPMNSVLAQKASKAWKALMKQYAELLGADLEVLKRANLPYQLRSFSIENYQGIKKVDIIEIEKDQQCIIFTGENGYGKTSILRAVLAGLIGGKDENKQLVLEDAIINVTHTDQGQTYSNVIENQEGEVGKRLKNVAAYGAHRIGLSTTGKTTVSEHLFDHDNNYSTPFINIEETLIKWELDEGGQKKYYEAVKNLLLNFLEGYVEDMRIFRTGSDQCVKYKEKGKSTYSTYSELASGFKSVLGLVGDIIIRLSKDSSASLSSLGGIVIIDEFDMHLHPIWQKKILMQFNKYLPRVQFILSTHSPIPFLGAPRNTTVIKVDRDVSNAHISAKILDVDFSELLPNAILTSPIFNFDELIPEAHDGESFPETSDYYYESSARAKAMDRTEEYYNQEREKKVLALVKKMENEEDK